MLITQLLTNMVILSYGVIQTDTPEFRQFESKQVVSYAKMAAVKWHLDTNLIGGNKITDIWIQPSLDGANARIVFSDRYCFSLALGRFLGKYDGGLIFSDWQYCWPEYSLIILESNYTSAKGVAMTQGWLNATNLLTMPAAQHIAESDVRLLGGRMGDFIANEPKSKQQKMWMLLGGKPKMEPYYTFDWESKAGACKIDVSGVNGKIVYFNYSDPTNFLLPSNYFRLLGISSNTIFVKPLTRSQGATQYETVPYRLP